MKPIPIVKGAVLLASIVLAGGYVAWRVKKPERPTIIPSSKDSVIHVDGSSTAPAETDRRPVMSGSKSMMLNDPGSPATQPARDRALMSTSKSGVIVRPSDAPPSTQPGSGQ